MPHLFKLALLVYALKEGSVAMDGQSNMMPEEEVRRLYLDPRCEGTGGYLYMFQWFLVADFVATEIIDVADFSSAYLIDEHRRRKSHMFLDLVSDVFMKYTIQDKNESPYNIEREVYLVLARDCPFGTVSILFLLIRNLLLNFRYSELIAESKYDNLRAYESCLMMFSYLDEISSNFHPNLMDVEYWGVSDLHVDSLRREIQKKSFSQYKDVELEPYISKEITKSDTKLPGMEPLQNDQNDPKEKSVRKEKDAKMKVFVYPTLSDFPIWRFSLGINLIHEGYNIENILDLTAILLTTSNDEFSSVSEGSLRESNMDTKPIPQTNDKLEPYMISLSQLSRGASFCSKGQWGSEVHLHDFFSLHVTYDPTEADYFIVPGYAICMFEGGFLSLSRIDDIYRSLLLPTEEYNSNRHYGSISLPYYEGNEHRHIFTFCSGMSIGVVKSRDLFVKSIILTPETGIYNEHVWQTEPVFKHLKDIAIPGHLQRYEIKILYDNKRNNYRRRIKDNSLSDLYTGAKAKENTDEKLVVFFGRNDHSRGVPIGFSDSNDSFKFAVRNRLFINFNKLIFDNVDQSSYSYKMKDDVIIGSGYTPMEMYYWMTRSIFCLIPRGKSAWSLRFYESIWAGCIPIILSDNFVIPWGEEELVNILLTSFQRGVIDSQHIIGLDDLIEVPTDDYLYSNSSTLSSPHIMVLGSNPFSLRLRMETSGNPNILNFMILVKEALFSINGHTRIQSGRSLTENEQSVNEVNTSNIFPKSQISKAIESLRYHDFLYNMEHVRCSFSYGISRSSEIWWIQERFIDVSGICEEDAFDRLWRTLEDRSFSFILNEM